MTTATKVIHPGQIIRLKLQIMGIGISKAARALGISRTHFSDIVNGQAGISASMALRLSLGIGGTAEEWLLHQMNYELDLARENFLTISRQVQELKKGASQ
ncbi:MAG: HigA family addiction module antitoxin [Azospira sp.]